MKTTREHYAAVADVLATYWREYGGFSALVRSPYLHLALILALASFGEWGKAWWELVIFVLPALIGFTLGGYAILIAFGDERFRAIIAGKSTDGQASPFVVVSTTFVHFILVQIISLLYSITARQICSPLSEKAARETGKICSLEFAGSEYLLQAAGFVGLTGFFYSIVFAIAATLAIFQISLWYDASKGGEGQ